MWDHSDIRPACNWHRRVYLAPSFHCESVLSCGASTAGTWITGQWDPERDIPHHAIKHRECCSVDSRLQAGGDLDALERVGSGSQRQATCLDEPRAFLGHRIRGGNVSITEATQRLYLRHPRILPATDTVPDRRTKCCLDISSHSHLVSSLSPLHMPRSRSLSCLELPYGRTRCRMFWSTSR